VFLFKQQQLTVVWMGTRQHEVRNLLLCSLHLKLTPIFQIGGASEEYGLLYRLHLFK
jgi:hypothetical protein